ncbi:IDEAL domain-containing protein [Ureibacillus sp. FSL K6-8385]|uniref:IDEAL domain-containing protein n=1 Tax=Ureibacillus terrenus TaxID=118246 RepID=A0A540V2E5_9BACL|nr:IDEAL domain-containing protein [Ureibacillus terrenus]MED3662619.1 IDEAL domain-containing protein [Ureibacillus terrenus]MED3764585.1 IDEAL domain-containing protein [Ureibacillus terrenus]TQE90922.1 IDEAL domain-containing protein [Ureibacillus terrenus]
MIQVQYMKPFYSKVSGNTLRLVFAYQYFSIVKDNEVYHFVPIEGKEIIVNLKTMQIENLSEIFVFQRGNRFLRLPLYQLLLISNVHEHLAPILEEAFNKADNLNLAPHEEDSEIARLIRELEVQNLDRLIDEALSNRDEQRFRELVEKKKKME